MSDNLKNGIGQLSVRLSLDGQPVELPSHLREPLMAIRTHLQLLSLRQNRTLSTFTIEANSTSLSPTVGSSSNPAVPEAEVLLPSAINGKFVNDVRSHIQRFIWQAEDLILLVLVNDWGVGNRLWLEIQPDLRGVLVALNLWHDMIVASAVRTSLEGRSLAELLGEWQPILTELNEARDRKDSLAFSNSLETRLVPWLKRLNQVLGLLEEGGFSIPSLPDESSGKGE